MARISNLKEDSREEKNSFLLEVCSESKALFRDLTKKSPYTVPIKAPIITDIIKI